MFVEKLRAFIPGYEQKLTVVYNLLQVNSLNG